LWGGKGADTFLFTDLENGTTEIDTIVDYDVAQLDRIDLPDGPGSIKTAELVNGVWQLTLVGDGDVIRLPGIRDVDGNGILNDLFLV
jgi:Ca2+-binding RTX toxin-like protein